MVTTTPPATLGAAEKTPDDLCPVLVHVHDPAILERRRSQDHQTEKRHRTAVEDPARNWIDLDENVLDDYILIDDWDLGPLVPETDKEELSYPEDSVEYDDDNDDDNNDDDENGPSHGRREPWSIYKRPRKSTAAKRYRPNPDLGATYPLANSHGNAYQDSSSHSKYTSELYAKLPNARNDRNAARELDTTSYAIANSHGEHGGRVTDIRNRGCAESSEIGDPAWDTRPASVNYEMANSHSNYRVFYDSQTQHPNALVPPCTSDLSENRRGQSHATSRETSTSTFTARKDTDECEMNANQSRQINKQDSGTICDIEQCLVQIEESLLDIEQNLLHVQDLDIPELRNLLYKSPSIERSLYEVKDLLRADGIVPIIARDKSMSLDSDEEEKEEEDQEGVEEEEEVWVGQNITVKDNDDEDGNAGAPLLNGSNEESSDTISQPNLSRSINNHYVDWTNVDVDGTNVMREEAGRDPNHQMGREKAMDFVPNSLGKTPRRIVLDEVRENIRLCSSKPEESAIDYNLNSACAEKKSLFRDKWHSRTNSLDENSIFQNPVLVDDQENLKSSLQSILVESVPGGGRLTAGVRTHSEGALQADTSKRRWPNDGRRGSHGERLLQAVEVTTEDFRKKLESFASQRRSVPGGKQRRNPPKSAGDPSDTTLQSRERSPTKPKHVTTAVRNQDRSNGAGNENTGYEKRKRKKTSGKGQSSSTESALEPSKLISLSLSLLLAALLQAVRCLTDLVEDAFRSISYDRSGMLQ